MAPSRPSLRPANRDELSAVEVEVARRALLEPEPVVLGGILEEFGRLLQRVTVLVGLLRERSFDVELGGLSERGLGCGGRLGRTRGWDGRRWRRGLTSRVIA